MIQCAVDVRKFDTRFSNHNNSGSLAAASQFGGRVEDPVHDKIAEHLVQGIFPTESGMFLVSFMKESISKRRYTDSGNLYP